MTFKREKFSALDGLTTVTRTEENNKLSPFTIIANQRGINFKGTLALEISNRKQLEQLAEAIGDSWKDHELLVPKVAMHSGGFNG
jgi:hypothetical protein